MIVIKSNGGGEVDGTALSNHLNDCPQCQQSILGGKPCEAGWKLMQEFARQLPELFGTPPEKDESSHAE